MSKNFNLEKEINSIDNEPQTWICCDCLEKVTIPYKEYKEIRNEYGKFYCSACREKIDNENIKSGLMKAIRSNEPLTFRLNSQKKLNEPNQELETLKKQLKEKEEIIKIQSMNNRVLLEEIIRLRENKNAK